MGGALGGPDRTAPDKNDPLRPEFQGLSSDLGAYSRSLVGKPATPYNGMLSASLGTGEQGLLDAITRMVSGGTNGGPALAFGPERNQLLSSILSGQRLDPNMNPFLGAMTNAVRDQGQETLGRSMNLVDAAFGGSGMSTGSGRSAEGIETARRVTGDTNNTIANMLGSNYQQGLQEQMQVLGQILPGMDATTSNMLFQALGAAAMPREVQQQGLDRQYAEFLRKLQEPIGNTQLATQILGSQPGLQFSAPSYEPMPYWQQLLMGAVQGASSGAAASMGAG